MGESVGYIAIILICGLFADSMLLKNKVKKLEQKIKELTREHSDKA